MRLLTATISLALMLLLLEIGIRLFHPQDLKFYDWTLIKRPSGKIWKPFDYVPGGYNEAYNGVPVRIDALGLRDRDFAVPKPECTFRIIGLGDSIAFGFGVKLEDTYLKVIEAELNRNPAGQMHYEVVNAGAEGTGLDYYYNFLLSSAPKLQPDVILLGITLNDILEYPTSEQAGIRPARASLLSGAVHALNEWVLRHSEFYLWSYLTLKSALYRAGVLRIESAHEYDFLPLEPDSTHQRKAWASTMQMLNKISELAEARKYKLVVVVFPMEVQLSSQTLGLYRKELHLELGPAALSGEPQRRLAAYWRSRNVPMIDPLPVFRNADHGQLYLRNKSITFDPVHPSVDGHKMLGDLLFKAMVAQGLFAHNSCDANNAASDGVGSRNPQRSLQPVKIDAAAP